MIGCLQDEKEGLADAKSGQSQKVSVFTTASREEIQAFLKENVKSVQAKRPAVFQKENTNGEGERIIRPLHYVKLLGEEAEAGIVQLMKEGKASQWVFYKQEGKLQANRVRVVRQSGTGKDSSFTGIIEVSALKARAWTVYVYKKDTLEKVYSGNGLLSNASNQCLQKHMYESMGPGEGGSGDLIENDCGGYISPVMKDRVGEESKVPTKPAVLLKLDPAYDGGNCGGGGGSYFGGYISPVVVTAHRHSPGSSSSSWGSGSSFDSRGIGSSSWGSGVGYPAGPVSPGSWGGGGGGGSYSGDDGESYYGGEIGAVTVTAHKKKKEEPERSGVILSPLPPLLPAGELIDERGEPLREKQEPPEKKEEEKDKKEPCKTTVEDLQKVFPGTDSSTLKEIADLVNQYGKDFGIDSKEKLQHFLAQAGEETYQLKTFHEYTNYRLSLLGTSDTYWKTKFNTIKDPTKPGKQNPNDYANPSKPGYADGKKLLNYVYGDNKTLGNTESGDGWKYRGRGILQLTGRANYTAFNAFYQQHYERTVDILAHPELLNDNKEIGVISGLWYFKNRVLSNLDINDKTSVKAVTKKINGYTNGINERRRLYNKAKTNIKCH